MLATQILSNTQMMSQMMDIDIDLCEDCSCGIQKAIFICKKEKACDG
jgi:hypothetical protein